MSLVRVIRGFAEGSLAVLAFAIAIVVLGIPLALMVRGLHDGLSALVRLRGDMSPLVEALVSVSSVAGSLVLALVVATLLVRFFHWRGTFRGQVISSETVHTNVSVERSEHRHDAWRAAPSDESRERILDAPALGAVRC